MPRTLCIWFPQWPLQRWLAEHPVWYGQPVVVHEVQRNQRACVLFVSPAAAEHGIRPQQALSEALVLGAEAPLHWQPHDAEADRQRLEKLAADCLQFVPRVSLDDTPYPDSLWLDLHGCVQLHGTEAALAKRVRTTLQQQGWHTQLAIADTPGAAWAVAHYGAIENANSLSSGGSRPPLAAAGATAGLPSSVRALASDYFACPPGETATTLAPLPLAALRLDGELLTRLRELGLHRIGQLETLDRSTLPSRFGNSLLLRWDQATGRLPEGLDLTRPVIPLERERRFEPPLADRQQIQFALTDLLRAWLATESTAAEDEVTYPGMLCTTTGSTGRLPARLGVLSLTCSCWGERQAHARANLVLTQPSRDADYLSDLLWLQGLHQQCREAVASIAIELTATATLAEWQADLFNDGPVRPAAAAVGELIERLSSRLGRGAVLRPELLAEHQPELACDYLPALASATRTKRSSERPLTSSPRPLRLLDPPRPLTTVPALTVTVPHSMSTSDGTYTLVRSWGPERIETGWWRGPAVQRDYYRVETTTGGHAWVFRQLNDSRWFLQGWFE